MTPAPDLLTSPLELTTRLRAAIADVPDFPRPGILFKDITPALADGALFQAVIEHLAALPAARSATAVAGIESRGFVFAAPLAVALGTGFTLVRKPGKLPRATVRVDYALEYGTDAVEAHRDAFGPGDRVLVVDDVLATGGTAAATVELVRRLGAQVVGVVFVLELSFLEGRSRLPDLPVDALLTY